jgi:phosphoglycolate phosphatase
MPIKLIIFDLDGTLVDSSIDIANAINYAVEPFGIQPVTVEETIRLVGEGITRLMEKVIERGQDANVRSRNKDLLIDRFLEYYSSHLTDNTTVYPGIIETLEKLNDCKKAVISNKRESLSVRTLENLLLLKYFDLIVGSETTTERKPSPMPVIYVLSNLNVKAENAVIVGDSNLDIEAGRAAGIKTIAVTYGYRPIELLKGADFIIDRMDELVHVLKSLR